MNASTRSISLVLLGSSLFLAGCRRAEDEERTWDDAPDGGGAPHVRSGGGFIPIPIGGFGRGGGGGVSAAPSAGSARGGFGGIGGGSASASS